MFAKLFDHISLRSLINALSFSLLLLGSIFFLPLGTLKIAALGYSQILPLWLSLGGLIFLGVFLPFSFSELQNRQRIFKGQNHLLVVLVLLLYATFFTTNNLHIIIMLPLALLFFTKLSRLVDVIDAKYVCFDLGLLAGLYSLLYGQLIILFFVALVAVLFQGKLNIRSLMALILGLFGGLSFVASIGVFIPLNFLDIWLAQLGSITLDFKPFSGLSWFTTLAILLAMALSYFSIPLFLSKANALQRSTYNLWFLVQSVLLFFTLILNEKALLSLFLALPAAWLSSKVLLEAKNKWFRDGLYFLLFSAGAYQTLSLMRVFTF